MTMRPARQLTLEQVKVNSPCPRSWDGMSGDERMRYCAHCGLHVHNLSAMTSDEAQALICQSAGRLCVAYVPSPSGTVTTLEYHTPPRPRYGRRLIACLAALAAMTGTALAAVIHRTRPAPPPPPQMIWGQIAPASMLTVGDIAAPPPPPAVNPSAADPAPAER